MQPYALTVDKFPDHAAKRAGGREVVTAGAGRVGYAALRELSARFSGAPLALGLPAGDRVGAPARNTQHHLEALLAALRGKVAAWWIPDQVVAVARMPLAAAGKIDKIRLRADYNSGALAA